MSPSVISVINDTVISMQWVGWKSVRQDGLQGNNLLPRDFTLFLQSTKHNIASTSASPRNGYYTAVKTVPVIEEMKNQSGKA